MKNIFTTLLLSTILLTNGVAQQISATAYNKATIHEDFSTEGDFFPIVTTTENYFIFYNQMIENLEACVSGKPKRVIE